MLLKIIGYIAGCSDINVQQRLLLHNCISGFNLVCDYSSVNSMGHTMRTHALLIMEMYFVYGSVFLYLHASGQHWQLKRKTESIWGQLRSGQHQELTNTEK